MGAPKPLKQDRLRIGVGGKARDFSAPQSVAQIIRAQPRVGGDDEGGQALVVQERGTELLETVLEIIPKEDINIAEIRVEIKQVS